MARERTVVRHFGDFGGYELAGPLSRAPQRGISARNLFVNSLGEVTGRPGFKQVAQHDMPFGKQFFPQHGIQAYPYNDPTTGATVQQLIGGKPSNLFRLKAQYMRLNRIAGALDYGYTFTLNPTTGTYRFVLYQGGSPITFGGNPYIDCGTGLESAPFTIYDLLTTIGSSGTIIADYPTQGGKVNGNQPGVNALTVFAGGTWSIGDYLWFIDSATGNWTAKRLYNVTATALAFPNVPNHSINSAASFTDLQLVGTALCPAAVLDIVPTLTTTTAASFDMPFQCWVPVSWFDAMITFRGRGEPNVSYANLGNTCYMSHDAPNGGGQPYMWDGQNSYLVGFPTTPSISSAVVGGAGNVDAGTHAYFIVFQFRDAQGNIYQSNASQRFYATPGVASQVTLTWPSMMNAHPPTAPAYYNIENATVNGNQVGVSTITVAANQPFKVGEYIVVFDRASGNAVRALISAVTNTTITIPNAVDVNNADIITRGYSTLIYRTRVGGIDGFLVKEIPSIGGTSGTTQSYVDNIGDGNLLAQYVEPDDVHDPPPRMLNLESHQGVLVGSGMAYDAMDIAGGNTPAPNTVFFSSAESPWYYPPQNQFDIPPSELGAITCIKSDSGGGLLIGKPRSCYYVSGDLVSGSFNFTILSENEYGCASHRAAVLAGGTLIFPTENGFVRIINGHIDEAFGDEVDGHFGVDYLAGSSANTTTFPNNKLDLNYVTAINYYQRNLVLWAFPETVRVGSASNAEVYGDINSIILAYDTKMRRWYDWSFTDTQNFNAIGGFAQYAGQLYFLSRGRSGNTVSSHLCRFHTQSINEHAFAEQQQAILYDLWLGWEFFGYPSTDKEFKWFELYAFTHGVAFDVRLRSYRNFQTTAVDTDAAKSFASSTPEQLWKLKLNKARAMSFRLTTNAIHTVPRFDGYDFFVSSEFGVDDPSRQTP